VVLVTDGQPNCNGNNPSSTCNDSSPSQVAACNCTTSSCARGTPLCSKGCNDGVVTQEAAQALADQGAQLMAVAVGSDLAPATSGLLSSMTLALPRTCATSTDCPGSSCGADGVCSNPLYFSTLAADYQAPADRLDTAVRHSAACAFWLDHDVFAANLTVTRASVAVAATEWSLSGTRLLKLMGAPCDALIAGGQAPKVSWLPPHS
jgi:hypothetical protein